MFYWLAIFSEVKTAAIFIVLSAYFDANTDAPAKASGHCNSPYSNNNVNLMARSYKLLIC